MQPAVFGGHLPAQGPGQLPGLHTYSHPASRIQIWGSFSPIAIACVASVAHFPSKQFQGRPRAVPGPAPNLEPFFSCLNRQRTGLQPENKWHQVVAGLESVELASGSMMVLLGTGQQLKPPSKIMFNDQNYPQNSDYIIREVDKFGCDRNVVLSPLYLPLSGHSCLVKYSLPPKNSKKMIYLRVTHLKSPFLLEASAVKTIQSYWKRIRLVHVNIYTCTNPLAHICTGF